MRINVQENPLSLYKQGIKKFKFSFISVYIPLSLPIEKIGTYLQIGTYL